MEIRSITLFDNPGCPLDSGRLEQARTFQEAARSTMEESGWRVQTTRYAAPPFPRLLPDPALDTVKSYAEDLEGFLTDAGFDYLSLGPALPEHPESYSLIPDVIAATEHVFLSGLLAAPGGSISIPAVQACGRVIQRLSLAEERGFANLYFAALANVPPGAPFFPAAYHGDKAPCFALAAESADLAVEAFTGAETLAQARLRLTQALETNSASLSSAGAVLEEITGMKYAGIDYSLAPYPEPDRSLGSAFEELGAQLGSPGSIAAAAFIADTIDRAEFPRTGFSGLMLPVLEDAALARRAAEGVLTVRDLLLYSAVCGTGLDTVPLPGNLSADQLSALLLDLAALAVRLDKPLTARLMPIPGKAAGDPTDFDFPYFANSRIMAVTGPPLEGSLQHSPVLDLAPRPAPTRHQE